MKKKKIILALLASLCVAAGAAGIAACSNSGTPSRDPTLYAAYQTYAESTENPKTYEEWLADILAKFAEGGEQGPKGEPGEDAVSIEKVNLITINGKAYYEFIFTSGKIIRLSADGEDKQETTCFTIIAVDQNGAPVANAYFNIGYYNSSTYETYYLTENGELNADKSQIYAAKTNSRGIATFYTFLSNNDVAYKVYIADPLSITGDGIISGVPDGYSVRFGSANGFTRTDADFVKDDIVNYSVTVNFTLSNSWDALYDSTNDLKYKRYVANPQKPEEITVDYTPYVKSVSSNRYNYFTLTPYKEVIPDGNNADIDNAIALAKKAASGVYRISWSASRPSANISLYSYSFLSGNYFHSNDDGSPADTLVTMRSGSVPTNQSELQATYELHKSFIGDEVGSYGSWLESYKSTFSGGKYVDIEVAEDQAAASFCLAFISDTNCNVTISVERIGEVPTWSDVIKDAEMPANATPASEGSGRIIDVPLTSSIVKDSSGNYCIGSVSGPIIYVQLNGSTRVDDRSMVYLSDYEIEVDGGTVKTTDFVFTTEEFDAVSNSGVRTHTNYSKVVQGYGELANSDGLYPVNDLIKTILEQFCKNFIGYQNFDEYWVAACSYYGPESDGSANAPYDLTTGNNTVNLNGTTHVAFKTNTTAYYGFSSSNGVLSVSGGIEIDGAYYVKINAHEEFVFTVTGNGAATVTVDTIASTKIIEYSFDGSNDVGTDSNPVTIIGSGIYQVNIDHSMSKGNKIAVDITALFLFDGEFRINVYGSSTAEILDASLQSINGKTIMIYEEIPTRFWVDDIADGTFFIKLTKIS